MTNNTTTTTTTKTKTFIPVWKQLLNHAQTTQGVIALSDPVVASIVKGYESRFINYVYGIKKCAKLECIPERFGKIVVAYRIPALAILSTAEETVTVSRDDEADAVMAVQSDAIAMSLS